MYFNILFSHKFLTILVLTFEQVHFTAFCIMSLKETFNNKCVLKARILVNFYSKLVKMLMGFEDLENAVMRAAIFVSK